jgi:hypothetical protein
MPVDKDHILSEIRRTANGGVALGHKRFTEVTGIGYYDWFGKYWARWSDAVREAGVEPSQMTEAYDIEQLVEQLVLLTRRLQRVPVQGDLRLVAKNDAQFPAMTTIVNRLGPKAERAARILAFCEANPGYDDVAALWRAVVADKPATEDEQEGDTSPTVGYVYLLKHGTRREYKIGRTNNPLRREGELGIQLPEKVEPIHSIKTDDPVGIESYWHRRFASKRKEGEWFALTAEDVRAFKRWKRIF